MVFLMTNLCLLSTPYQVKRGRFFLRLFGRPTAWVRGEGTHADAKDASIRLRETKKEPLQKLSFCPDKYFWFTLCSFILIRIMSHKRDITLEHIEIYHKKPQNAILSLRDFTNYLLKWFDIYIKIQYMQKSLIGVKPSKTSLLDSITSVLILQRVQFRKEHKQVCYIFSHWLYDTKLHRQRKR